KVEHDALADARHVVDERRHHGGSQHIDRPPGKTGAEQANDRVTAHEVADPHVRHDKDGAVVAHGRLSAKTSARAQPGLPPRRSRSMPLPPQAREIWAAFLLPLPAYGVR